MSFLFILEPTPIEGYPQYTLHTSFNGYPGTMHVSIEEVGTHSCLWPSAKVTEDARGPKVVFAFASELTPAGEASIARRIPFGQGLPDTPEGRRLGAAATRSWAAAYEARVDKRIRSMVRKASKGRDCDMIALRTLLNEAIRQRMGKAAWRQHILMEAVSLKLLPDVEPT